MGSVVNKLRRDKALRQLGYAASMHVLKEAYEIGWSHASEQSDQLLEEWVDEVCERIAERYSEAGTDLKGLKPIAEAILLAFEMGRVREQELIRRLEIIREYMREVEFWHMSYENPDIKYWFDENGKVML